MRDLKCGLKLCRHNKGYSCQAKAITVDQDTNCLTYSPDQHKKSSMFEAGTDFASPNYSIDTNVGCAAECLFQKHHKCIANGITVAKDGQSHATCLTFIKS